MIFYGIHFYDRAYNKNGLFYQNGLKILRLYGAINLLGHQITRVPKKKTKQYKETTNICNIFSTEHMLTDPNCIGWAKQMLRSKTTKLLYVSQSRLCVAQLSPAQPTWPNQINLSAAGLYPICVMYLRKCPFILIQFSKSILQNIFLEIKRKYFLRILRYFL